MKFIIALVFIQASIVISQLVPGEFQTVNLTSLNLSPQSIALANVKYYTAFTSIIPNATSTVPRRQIHQVFVENQAQVANKSFPIFVMPFGYMPGVSSLYTLFNELGSFTFSSSYQTQAQLQSLPYGLTINQNSFANSAHLLFIDPIPGVGLSYWSSTAPTNFTFTDSQIVSDVFRVLYSFQVQGNYPNSTYYLIGNGYASKIATLLASQWKTNLNLTLGGLFLQNPAMQYDNFVSTQINQEEINQFQFLNAHNLIGDTISNAILTCQSSTSNAVCTWALQQVEQISQNLNYWNIFNYCFNDSITPYQFGSCTYNYGLYKLVNDQQFKNAFFAIFGNHTESVNFQNIFNTQINYTYDATQITITTLQALITANQLNICLYNGDASAVLSNIDTYYYLNQMTLNLANNQPAQALLNVRYPQPIGLQLGGIYTQYQGLLYAQIKKGGFFTAKDQPQSTLALVNFFLTGQQQQ